MIGLLASEWIKTKRTAVRWLTFFLPVLFSLAILGYVALRPNTTNSFLFQGFFEAWSAFVIPIAIGVLAAFIVQEEELAGNFIGYLSNSTARSMLYFGKFILLFLCMAISTIIATVVLCLGSSFVLPSGVSSLIYTCAAILVIFGILPLLSIHLWISFAWGTGASIGVGMSGLVIATLIGTTELGDKVWPFIPWAWPAKLAALPGEYLNFTVGMAAPPTEIATGSVVGQLLTGCIAVTICIVAFLVGGIMWFNKWEGRKYHE